MPGVHCPVEWAIDFEFGELPLPYGDRVQMQFWISSRCFEVGKRRRREDLAINSRSYKKCSDDGSYTFEMFGRWYVEWNGAVLST